MRKSLFSCFVASLFCLLLLNSCATIQKFFVSYEIFEVKLGEMSLSVKMPPEIPLELIKAEESWPFPIVGDFIGIRFVFDEVHVYDYIDFVLKLEGDKLKIYVVASWAASGVPTPECWFYVDEFPFPSTLKEIMKFLQGE